MGNHYCIPDSEIVKNYYCIQTKMECILNYALAPHLNELVTAMKQQPYSLSVDAYNDTGLSKMNPVTVWIFDVSWKTVSQKFLDLCLTKRVDASKSKEIFDAIQNTLERYKIPWIIVLLLVWIIPTVILELNTPSNQVVDVNPTVYFVRCPCHIIHNAAQKATEAFREMCGVDIEDCCVYYNYWFDKITKWKERLQQYSTFCDTALNVRWLSLQNAVERTLQMFAASTSYLKG